MRPHDLICLRRWKQFLWIIWSKKCSLRSKCINQLKSVLVNGAWSNFLGSHGKWLSNQLKCVTGECCHHNCWVVLDGRQQEILRMNSCSQHCWTELGMKQKTFTFYCCIVCSCFGRMQKALVKLEKCCLCNCSCCCGDLSLCLSCCCSCCGEGLRSCDIIQTGVAVIVCLKSSRCYSRWDKNLQII